MKRFVFNFTPTGMIPTKEMTPHVPVSPQEIIDETVLAAELGVNIVHLHARDTKTGCPSPSKEIYAQMIEGIRAKCPELIITVSTSGRDWPEFEKRSAVLDLDGDLKPDMASLTLSSLNFNNHASLNAPETIKALALRMFERGIKPELEVFDAGMINYARYLESKNLIKAPHYYNLILGNIACAQADPFNLGLLIRELPEGATWAAGGVGKTQFHTNVMALLSGGGVRIGLEDNIWFDEARTKLATNIELLERLVDVALRLEMKPYSCGELRKKLALNRD